MGRHHELLDEWLHTHHGVVTRKHLSSLGFSSRAASYLVESGRLLAHGDGIYRSPHVPLGRLQGMAAACLANSHVAIGFTTAGGEWGFRGMRDERIHVLVPHGCSPELPGVVVHRCRRIDPVDLAGRRADGIRLTSPPRTLFDAAALLSEDTAASAVEQALADRRCTIDTLMSTLTRLNHPNRPGARRFEAVLHSRPTLRGLARSELERKVRAAIAAAGLPMPQVNSWLPLPGVGDIWIDLAWPEWTLAVEVDHPFWHDREAEAARDKRRDRKLAVAGWLPLRISKLDVERRLDDAVADLGAVLVQRGWTPTGSAA